MPGSPYVLLPPSEGKEPGGSPTRKVGAFDDILGAKRSELTRALADLLREGDPSSIVRVMNVRGALLDRAVASTRAIVAGEELLLPAWRRFNGVVWSNLDPSTLSVAQRRRILIPSGLYGLSAATDLVADFRLRMNVNLSPIGGVAKYWRPSVTEALGARVRRATVVNLLPKEHSAAIDFDSLRRVCEVVSLSFVSHDGSHAVGHDAKAAKGRIARQVLDDGVESITSFRWRGWQARGRDGEFEIVAPKIPVGPTAGP